MALGCSRTSTDQDGRDALYNSVAFVDPAVGGVRFYDKIGLVPWTEFIPREGLTAQRSQQFSHGSQYPVFRISPSGGEGPYLFSVGICYEAAFGELFRSYMRRNAERPDFFALCSSERSDKTSAMSRDILSMVQIRAIETRRAFVRNVHFGYSGVVSSNGEFQGQGLAWDIDTPTPVGPIPIDRRLSLYAIAGDWLPLSAAAIVFGTTVWRARLATKNRRKKNITRRE